MKDLLEELIYETVLFEQKKFIFENKKNKPPKNIIKGKKYKCIVRKTASKKFKKEIKKNHKSKKFITVKVIEPDGRGDFIAYENNGQFRILT